MDLSGNGFDGDVSYGNEANIWNVTESYGALFSAEALIQNVTNMSGYLSFNRDSQNYFYNNSQPMNFTAANTDELTVEMWVKPSSQNPVDKGAYFFNIFATSDMEGAPDHREDFKLYDPQSLTVRASRSTLTSTANVQDGFWHHIAVTRKVTRDNQEEPASLMVEELWDMLRDGLCNRSWDKRLLGKS